MKRTLASLFVAFSINSHGVAQQGQKEPPHNTVQEVQDARVAHAEILSIAEIHDIARRVSVLIAERNEQSSSGTRHVGSGVWLAEGFVATCWHVVKDLKGPIKISLGAGGVVTVGGSTFEGIFMDYAAAVVASDPVADIAILKTTENPFRSGRSLITTPTQELKPKMAVAHMNESNPVAGTLTVLSGYPLAGLDLVSQTGNVAGTGILPANLAVGGGSAEKSLRLLVSVVSNPGNSGGPVLNDRGELIGILEGNWQSPARDETGAQAVYFRPKKDVSGNILKDANGNPQVEMAALLQNSGISLVVPAHLIIPLLKHAQAAK
jgi:S1-C subfamily serine protease